MTIQISNFDISDKSHIEGSGKAAIVPHRKDIAHSGVFTVKVNVGFDPPVNDYPTGGVSIDIDLSDSFKGNATSTSPYGLPTRSSPTMPSVARA